MALTATPEENEFLDETTGLSFMKSHSRLLTIYEEQELVTIFLHPADSVPHEESISTPRGTTMSPEFAPRQPPEVPPRLHKKEKRRSLTLPPSASAPVQYRNPRRDEPGPLARSTERMSVTKERKPSILRLGSSTDTRNIAALRRGSSVMNNSLKEGYLTKRGNTFQSWKRRWCVLQHSFLFYFRRKTDEHPLGAVPIQDCLHCGLQPTGRHKFCFVVRTRARAYFITYVVSLGALGR